MQLYFNYFCKMQQLKELYRYRQSPGSHLLFCFSIHQTYSKLVTPLKRLIITSPVRYYQCARMIPASPSEKYSCSDLVHCPR